MPDSQALFEKATSSMKAHDYPTAISLFEAQRAQSPDDLNALLHLGICHLLNHSVSMFLTLYEDAKKLKNRLQHIPDHVVKVFSQYAGLVRKVTATALVVSTVAGAACGLTAHKYSGGVYQPKEKELPAEVQPADSDTVSGDSQASSIDADALETRDEVDPNPQDTLTHDTGANDVITPSPEEDGTMSAHKYSGGVYLKPQKDLKPFSAHRYSGGVSLKRERK